MKTICLIGYSGHSYVVYDCFFSQGQIVTAYTEQLQKKQNPFSLRYLGNEYQHDVLEVLKDYEYFVAVGDNQLRKKITEHLIQTIGQPVIALHKTAILSRTIQCGEGVMIGPRAVVNSMAVVGHGVIVNSGAIIEHECIVENYVHIAPGAVLCGQVKVGENTLIGAGSIVKPGVTIGKNAIVGAGSVVVNDLPDEGVYFGNPARRKGSR